MATFTPDDLLIATFTHGHLLIATFTSDELATFTSGEPGRPEVSRGKPAHLYAASLIPTPRKPRTGLTGTSSVMMGEPSGQVMDALWRVG